MCFAKNKEFAYLKGDKKDFSQYQNPDNDPNGEWISDNPTAPRDGDRYPIINPYTGKTDIPPKGRAWFFSKENFELWVKTGKIKFKKEHRENERGFILKRYRSEIKNSDAMLDSLLIDNSYLNQAATKEQIKLFEDKVFDSPKSVALLSKIVASSTDKNSLILDFFAGSGTTAHAVMQLNAEDGGNRRFIMVQLPEEIKPDSEAYKAGFRTIADITKERIRRAGAQLRDSSASVKPSINENGLFNDGVFSSPPPQNQDLDVGFRVLKIDSSNMEDVYYRPDELSQDDLFVENIKPDRSSEDLLFQVMIDYGVSVSLPIAQKRIVNAPVYCVDKNFLVACFEGLSMAVVDEIAKLRPTHFVSRDGAVKHDHDKANIRQRFKVLSLETRVVFL